jgi:hypothetical protein
MTYEDAMVFWQARDAYRVQTAWMVLCGMAFGLPFVLLLTHGHWVKAIGILGLWWLVEWALPRGLRWLLWQMQDGARWAGRWSLEKAWRWWLGRLVLVVVLSGLLTGCQPMACGVARLYGLHGDPQTGLCMPTPEPEPVHLPTTTEEATR